MAQGTGKPVNDKLPLGSFFNGVDMPTLNAQFWAIVLLALIIGLGAGAVGGNHYGRKMVQADWDKQTSEQNKKAVTASEGNRSKEQTHAIQSNEVSDNAQVSKQKYDEDIAAAQSGSDDRVRQSEARADKYRAMSQASAAEQKRLAEYAARLDRSLSEGRQLVAELRATLAERERTIHNLNQQINADRQLTGEANEPSRNGTPERSGKTDGLGK